jgi:hypothetical protein
MKAWTGFQPGREARICMRCPGRECDGGTPQATRLYALPPRWASCATLDAWHNWHGWRYENPPDMVLPRVCCEILQVCPLHRRLLLRGW